jgi:large-conductance mechanosensitive channel
MPVINWMISATGGNWRNLLFVPVPGLEIEIGNFASGFIEFTITTAFLYIIYVTIVKRIDPDSEISVK